MISRRKGKEVQKGKKKAQRSLLGFNEGGLRKKS